MRERSAVVSFLFFLLLCCVSFILTHNSSAVEPEEMLRDEKLEQRARSISEGLRCLVCQNQSIDDSDAPLAKDLRLLVRERLLTGDSDEAVIGYIVERYGEFVLLKPPFSFFTFLLWLSPLFILGGALYLVIKPQRGRSHQRTNANVLSPKEELQLENILFKAGKSSSQSLPPMDSRSSSPHDPAFSRSSPKTERMSPSKGFERHT